MHIAFTILFVALSLFGEAIEVMPVDNFELIELAQTELSAVGTLRQTDQGFVYLAVDEAFIYRLFPLVKGEGYELHIPPYFSGKLQAGAHVTVMSSAEVAHYDVGAIEELGEQIGFVIIGFGFIDPKGWPGADGLWCLLVECPRLSELRVKYGLPLKDMAFHITVAIGVSLERHPSESVAEAD
ncbi:MAG: hypothetical protein LLG04_14110 [Parachlamydia sp.]|nr:hypothetical protein [Parachlamydia sp.]